MYNTLSGARRTRTTHGTYRRMFRPFVITIIAYIMITNRYAIIKLGRTTPVVGVAYTAFNRGLVRIRIRTVGKGRHVVWKKPIAS